ncbi:MAG: dienelactone hydrolase family protein [Blastocatellia bacterium]|nr:dienelactone hydrolase family protein [Blastocatellia bacterium]
MASELTEDQRFFYRVHCAYEPASVVERIKVPVLYLLGGKDRHIPVPETQAALAAAFAKGGNPDVTIRFFPNAGHGGHREGAAESLPAGEAPGIAPPPGAPPPPPPPLLPPPGPGGGAGGGGGGGRRGRGPPPPFSPRLPLCPASGELRTGRTEARSARTRKNWPDPR